MPMYRVYGKSFHREQSDYFNEVVKARSPKVALHQVARSLCDVESVSDIQWETAKPTKVTLGHFDPEIRFWTSGEELYKVRTITLVEPREVICPNCRGTGTAVAYEDVEQSD